MDTQVSTKAEPTETTIYLYLLHAKYKMNQHIQKRTVLPNHQVSNSVYDELNKNDVVLKFTFTEMLNAQEN